MFLIWNGHKGRILQTFIDLQPLASWGTMGAGFPGVTEHSDKLSICSESLS